MSLVSSSVEASCESQARVHGCNHVPAYLHMYANSGLGNCDTAMSAYAKSGGFGAEQIKGTFLPLPRFVFVDQNQSLFFSCCVAYRDDRSYCRSS